MFVTAQWKLQPFPFFHWSLIDKLPGGFVGWRLTAELRTRVITKVNPFHSSLGLDPLACSFVFSISITCSLWFMQK